MISKKLEILGLRLTNLFVVLCLASGADAGNLSLKVSPGMHCSTVTGACYYTEGRVRMSALEY